MPTNKVFFQNTPKSSGLVFNDGPVSLAVAGGDSAKRQNHSFEVVRTGELRQ